MLKTFFRLLLSLAIISIITFVFLEIAVRVVGYSTVYFYDPIYMPFAENDQIPFVIKPDLRNARAHGNIYIHTDRLGLRSLMPGRAYGGKSENEYRVALLGDSITFGYGVKTEDTYAVRLEQILGRACPDRRVTVFNFGVSSYSLKEMDATLKHRTPAIEPDLIVAAIIYGDFDLSRTPGLDPSGYHTHSETSVSRVMNKLPQLKSVLREFHASYFIRDMILMIKSRFEGGRDTSKLPSSYHYLPEMKEGAGGKGIPCLILLLPSIEGDGSQFDTIRKELEKDQVSYLDTSPISRLFTPEEFKASRFDFHPSSIVHQKIAEMLSQHLLERGMPPGCRPAPLLIQ